MARVYAALIIKGVKTIDQVPEKLRVEVQASLESEDESLCPKSI